MPHASPSSNRDCLLHSALFRSCRRETASGRPKRACARDDGHRRGHPPRPDARNHRRSRRRAVASGPMLRAEARARRGQITSKISRDLDDHQQRAAAGGALLLGQQKQSPARRTVGGSSRREGIALKSAAGERRHSCLHEPQATPGVGGSRGEASPPDRRSAEAAVRSRSSPAATKQKPVDLAGHR